MKKIILASILFVLFSFISLIFNVPQNFAACVSPGVNCGSISGPAIADQACCSSGGTTYTCSAFGVEKKCRPTATACICDSPNVSGVGKNGFNCTYEGKTVHGYCNGSEKTCIDSTGSLVSDVYAKDTNFPPGLNAEGVRCEPLAGTAKSNLDPGEPPCIPPFDNKGRCTSVSTSFGAFSTDPIAFILRIFSILLAVSGAIALLLIMRAGYKIMTSRGNPEGVKEGREQIVAAIVGLMFLIFSFVFLQVITGDLLRIPTFSTPGSSCSSDGGSCLSASACNGGGVESLGLRDCSQSKKETCCKANHCGTVGGTCGDASTCNANGGTVVSNYCGSGVCCKPPLTSLDCQAVGGSCITHAACVADGGTITSGKNCRTGTVCCK